MDALRDHYIVVGYGRLGQTIVEELLASGSVVCVIKKDAASVARVEALGHAAVLGDGANDDVLRARRLKSGAYLLTASFCSFRSSVTKSRRVVESSMIC